MAARIVEVRDAVVERIAAWWEPAAPDEVIGPWEIDLDTRELKGRRVQVFPSTYAGGPVSRLSDQNDYSIVIVVAELYPDDGPIGARWIDGLVGWCEQLLNEIGSVRAARLLAVEGQPDSGLWPETAECTTVYDLEELTERKLFLSVLTVLYREQVEA